jgi:hypothetical protein
LDLLFLSCTNDINSSNFNFEGTKTSGEKSKKAVNTLTEAAHEKTHKA